MSDTDLWIDGRPVAVRAGDTLMSAAARAGVYIPHLCHHPDLPPQGNCRLCTVKVAGRYLSACTAAAEPGLRVDNETDELRALRRTLIELLFVEGNHSCPGCERSGNCQLQASAYALGMTDSHFSHRYPHRAVDASHPRILLDRERCILCGLCVRAGLAEGKAVFGIGGRGADAYLAVHSDSGRLGDSPLEPQDLAAQICPVGALLTRGEGFRIPIGRRLYDRQPITLVGHRRPRYDGETDQ